MDVIRKQASKLREQVAKQQQAILKQFSGRFGNDHFITEEAEIQYYEQLKRLYNSTRAAKHFQKDLIRSVEDLIYVSFKQMEIAKRLAENCCRYGSEKECPDSSLARVSLKFGTSRNMMEREREILHKILDSQVSEPLRIMIKGAPLEDARHLMHQYHQSRQEFEAQAAEVLKKQMKAKEAAASADSALKLLNAESKLSTLKSVMLALGKEATVAMKLVESQQQQQTLELLFTMVDAERSYHKAVASILEELHTEMVLEKQQSEFASQSSTTGTDTHAMSALGDRTCDETGHRGAITKDSMHYIAEAIHSFDAQAKNELSLSVGDYVVVRQVMPDGWSEGECMGKAGWFPSAYIERRDGAPSNKVFCSDATPSS